jgi:molecular chaperone GrpE (heat shock protein)
VVPESASDAEVATEGVEAEPTAAAPPAAGEGAPSADEAPGDGLRQVLQRLEERFARELAELRQRFDDRLVYDRFKEEQVSRLHEELQTYKQDLLARASRPILQGVIRLYGDLGKTVAALRARPPAEVAAADLSRALDDVRDDLELLLGQHGVERFEMPGDLLEPARQTVVRTVPTADSALVGRIAERGGPGFVQGQTLLQREKVAVYAGGSVPAAAEPAANPPADPDEGGKPE